MPNASREMDDHNAGLSETSRQIQQEGKRAITRIRAYFLNLNYGIYTILYTNVPCYCKNKEYQQVSMNNDSKGIRSM